MKQGIEYSLVRLVRIKLQPPTKDLVAAAGGAVFFHMHKGGRGQELSVTVSFLEGARL